MSELAQRRLARIVESSFFSTPLYHHLLCAVPACDDGAGDAVVELRDGVLHYNAARVEACDPTLLRHLVFDELNRLLTGFPDSCGGDVVFIERVRNLILRARDQDSWSGSVPKKVWLRALKQATDEREPTTAMLLRRFATRVRRASGQRTRMRPNRRMGFDAPGRVRANGTRFLVAVQMGNSIKREDFEAVLPLLRHALAWVSSRLDVVHYSPTGLLLSEPRALTHADLLCRIEGVSPHHREDLAQAVRRKHYSGLIVMSSKALSNDLMARLDGIDAVKMTPSLPSGGWVCDRLGTMREMEESFDFDEFIERRFSRPDE